MYLSHYKLKIKPFQISTDPKFLWLGEKHKEALSVLKYGIEDNKGFLFLTGDIGTGKTTLIKGLLNILGDDVIAASVQDPGLTKLDFFNFIADAFQLNTRFNSKGDFLIHISRFLEKAHSNNKKVLLIIDESQRISHELLEEIRLLSNIEKPEAKLLNIFFVGQNEFNNILLEKRNSALRQRITINYNIKTLTEQETGEYVKHRLKVAGSSKKIFSLSAVREIFLFSKGYPRLINIICDHALLTGYISGVTTLNDTIIKECAEELKIRPPKKSGQEARKRQKTLERSEYRTEKEKSKKGVGLNKSVVKKESYRKPVWRTAVYTALTILLLIVFGYFFYSGTYNDENIARFTLRQQAAESIRSLNPFSETRRSDGQTAANNRDSNTIDLLSNSFELDGESDENENRFSVFDEKKQLPIIDQIPFIYFDYNSNTLAKEATKILDHISAAMIQNPDIEIVIKGYAYPSGPYAPGKTISTFRANVVKNYLVNKGINSSKVRTLVLGQEFLGKKNQDRDRKKLSQRLEIAFKIGKSG